MSVCPGCGRCRECGHPAPAPAYPYWSQPYPIQIPQPIWINPYPTVTQPYVTITNTSGL